MPFPSLEEVEEYVRRHLAAELPDKVQEAVALAIDRTRGRV